MLKNSPEIEICCFSLKSALVAHQVSADRIELCGGFLEGGTTPSHGLIEIVLEAVKPKVYIMIRPRGGDFKYSKSEALTIYKDILAIKKMNPAGFVFGALKANGEIDKDLCQKVIEWASPYPVTFHRAFDQCTDPLKSLKEIIALGFERILTSGQKQNAIDGLPLLIKLVSISQNRIQIMAGAGVNENNCVSFLTAGIHAIHFTAKEWKESQMEIAEKVDMLSSPLPDGTGNYETSLAKTNAIIKKLRN